MPLVRRQPGSSLGNSWDLPKGLVVPPLFFVSTLRVANGAFPSFNRRLVIRNVAISLEVGPRLH